MHDRLEDYLDGVLAPEEADRFKGHLEACADCRAELALIDRLQTLAREVEEPEVPPELARAIRARVAGACPPPRGRLLRPAVLAGLSAVAAAVLLVALLIPQLTSTPPMETATLREPPGGGSTSAAQAPPAPVTAAVSPRAVEDWLSQAANASVEEVPDLVAEAKKLGLLARARRGLSGAVGFERRRWQRATDLLLQIENDPAAAPALPAEARLVMGEW